MAGARILVVEDDPDTRETLADLLRVALEVEVHTACDGEEALRRLSEPSTRYDVVLTDERMPKMAGSQLLQWAREHRPHVQRALMSAYHDGSDLAQAAGSQAFLAKPLDLDGLLTTLRTFLAKATDLDEEAWCPAR